MGLCHSTHTQIRTHSHSHSHTFSRRSAGSVSLFAFHAYFNQLWFCSWSWTWLHFRPNSLPSQLAMRFCKHFAFIQPDSPPPPSCHVLCPCPPAVTCNMQLINCVSLPHLGQTVGGYLNNPHTDMRRDTHRWHYVAPSAVLEISRKIAQTPIGG